jgi:hypothetical protein
MNASNDFQVNPFSPQAIPQQIKKDNKRSSKKPLLVFTLALVAVTGAGGYLYYTKDQEVRHLKEQVAGVQTDQEYQLILNNVKKITNIPEDETVRVALVDDPETLKTQNAKFYADVKKGQYLIIMPKSQRVLIYDKDLNKITNFSSYSIKVDLIPEADIPASEKPLTIEIRYQVGVDQKTIDQIKQTLTKASANYKIIATAQTAKSNYEGLTLVLLNKTNKPKLSQNIMAHTGTSSIGDKMPDGEAASTADAVIIVGKIAQ